MMFSLNNYCDYALSFYIYVCVCVCMCSEDANWSEMVS